MSKNRSVLGIVVIGMLVFVVASLFIYGNYFAEENECVRVDVGCCPCESGGNEMCVLKSEALEIEKEKNCSGDIFCAAVYSCEITSQCEYVDGECVSE